MEECAVLVADRGLEWQVDDWSGSEKGKLDVLVAGAGVWMIVMGEELWERLGGRIGKDRWDRWKKRLQYMSRREELVISSRELAATGVAVMQRAA